MTLETTPLLADERKARILNEVASRGGVRVTELVTLLGVSSVTIRRDIIELADRGLVTKVHGGATAPRSSAHEPSFSTKDELAVGQKLAIAAAAARLINPGDSISISAGTTTAHLARALNAMADLTVVTNSLPVANVLDQDRRSDRSVILTGGVRTPSDALVGPLAVAALDSLHVDRLFMGVHGLSVASGLTTPNLLEAETSRALVTSAGTVVVLADSSKWDTIGLRTIVGLDQVDILVTDSGLSSTALSQAQDHIADVRIVDF